MGIFGPFSRNGTGIGARPRARRSRAWSSGVRSLIVSPPRRAWTRRWPACPALQSTATSDAPVGASCRAAPPATGAALFSGSGSRTNGGSRGWGRNGSPVHPLPRFDKSSQVGHIEQSARRDLYTRELAAIPQVINRARGYAQQPARLATIDEQCGRSRARTAREFSYGSPPFRPLRVRREGPRQWEHAPARFGPRPTRGFVRIRFLPSATAPEREGIGPPDLAVTVQMEVVSLPCSKDRARFGN